MMMGADAAPAMTVALVIADPPTAIFRGADGGVDNRRISEIGTQV
jgi:hypothetical protein